MGMRPIWGVLGGLISAGLLATGARSDAVIEATQHALTMPPEPDMLRYLKAVRSTPRRHFYRSPGSRAHRNWRRRRAAGRG